MVHYISLIIFLISIIVSHVASLLPPKFQWKTIDFAWQEPDQKQNAMDSGAYIAENIMPTGLARWKNKLFITIPRWKPGVPSSLNYVNLNDVQDAPLNPYPNWREGCLSCNDHATSNRTVVSTFRVHVDKCDRLWVVDNGVTDMSTDVQQITPPAILVFDLNTDDLVMKHVFEDCLLRDTSVLSSVVVDLQEKPCNCSGYAYITDLGSNAIIVFDMLNNDAWRVENHYFHFDPHAGVYRVGGIDFYWREGVSSAALSAPKSNGHSDLYLMPTSSTKQFKMSTQLLKKKNTPVEDLFNGVQVVGDRGPKSQATACDIDSKTNVLFYTQVCQNGLGCWNLDVPFNKDNTPIILSDCNLMEFPNDVKVDSESNVWILSDRQSRFLFGKLNPDDVNFRVLTAPAAMLTRGTTCAKKPTCYDKVAGAFGFR